MLYDTGFGTCQTMNTSEDDVFVDDGEIDRICLYDWQVMRYGMEGDEDVWYVEAVQYLSITGVPEYFE